MSAYEPDQSLDAEGIPDMYDAPPGRDVETNEESFMAPRDYPIAAGEDPAYAVTASEERQQETVAERASRELPDVAAAGLDEEASLGGSLMAPDSDVESPDLTSEEVALVSEDDTGGLTAEEAAVRVAPEDIADDVDPAVEAAEYLEGR